MPSWKKVIVSGSSPHFNEITASGNISASLSSTSSFGYGHFADKVGIGTANPATHLEIRDDAGGGQLQLNGKVWSGYEPLGTIGFFNYQTDVTSSMIVARTPDYNTKGELLFYTNNVDGASPRLAMTIQSNKSVNIHSGSLTVANTITGDSGSFGRVNSTKISGSIVTAAQPSITSLGTMTNVSGSMNSTGSFGHLIAAHVEDGGMLELKGRSWSGYEPVGTISFYNDQTNDVLGKIVTRIPNYNTAGEMLFYTNNSEEDNPRLAMTIKANKDVEVNSGSLIVSGNITATAPSTGSFGRVEATTFSGSIVASAQPNITSLGTMTTVSGSMSSTGSFGHLIAAHVEDGGMLELNGRAWSGYEPVGTISFYNEQTSDTLAKIVTRIPDYNTKGEMLFYTNNADEDDPRVAMTIKAHKDVHIDSGSLIVAGSKISGSLTSTGSFGRGYVSDNSHVGGILTVGSTSTPDATYGDGSIELFGNGSTALVINDTRASNRQHVVFADTGGMTIASDPSNTISVGYFRVKVAGSEVFRIAEGGNTGIGITDPDVRNGLLQLGSSGGISILASGNVSGSLSSTGSFGSLVVADKVQGDLTVAGNVVAEQYIVSSSVTHLTQSFSSGSTLFGDTIDDTHVFTGSLELTGSVQLENSGQIKFKRANGVADPFIDFNSSENFRIFNPTNNEIQFVVNSGEIAVFDSAGLTFNGSKTIKSNSGAGVITLQSGAGGKLQLDGNKISGSLTSTGSFGKVKASLGESSVAHPAYSFVEDDDTGIGSDEAGTIQIITAGTQALGFNSSQTATFAGDLQVPAEINHVGDADTGLRFDADTFKITTGGNQTIFTTTKVSGSLTSTGSFGSLVVVDKVQGSLEVGTTITAASEITSKAGIQINSGATLLGGLYNSGGKVHLRGEGDRDVSIGSGNNADRVIIDTSTGDVEFTAANAKISGSITSTGSFGAGQFAGNVTPKANGAVDLGSDSLRWANIYSSDLQLSNEGQEGNEVDGTTGNWTIQEGNDDLFIINRKTGKKYKFLLEEVT